MDATSGRVDQHDGWRAAATIDASIMIIAMPDIFRGIGLDPLVPATRRTCCG
jgi:hypothetical protein